MKNFFVILKGDFEAEVIIRLLKRNNQEFLVVEKKDWDRFDQWSDQAQHKVLNKLGNRYQVYFIKFPMNVSGELFKNVRVIDDSDAEEIDETALFQVSRIIDHYFTIFDLFVMANQIDCIFGMNGVINDKRGNYSRTSLLKMRENVLRGEQIAQGATRRELAIAKVAVENKKEYYGTSSRSLTVVNLPCTDRNGHVIDLLISEDGYGYDILLIRMQSGQLIFSPYRELTDKIQEKIQELGEESWTTRRETSTKDRIFIKDKNINMEKIIRDYIVS